MWGRFHKLALSRVWPAAKTNLGGPDTVLSYRQGFVSGPALPPFQSVCLSVRPADLPPCLSVCLSVRPSLPPSFPVCLSGPPSLPPSLSVCLSVRPSLPLSLSVCLACSARLWDMMSLRRSCHSRRSNQKQFCTDNLFFFFSVTWFGFERSKLHSCDLKQTKDGEERKKDRIQNSVTTYLRILPICIKFSK